VHLPDHRELQSTSGLPAVRIEGAAPADCSYWSRNPKPIGFSADAIGNASNFHKNLRKKMLNVAG
jgi:hypothetical protein